MEIGAFRIKEPVPALRQPIMLVSLTPWIDVGSVGTLSLSTLEKHLNAEEIGALKQPGVFYDFTRYRPTLYRVEGRRQIIVPNSRLHIAKTPEGPDLVFLHVLEPHCNGDQFVDSLVELAQRFSVGRYCQLGSMYGMAPHTRPLLVSGHASDSETQKFLEGVGVRGSNYQGPTSIVSMATDVLLSLGIDTMTLIVQLPPYVRLEEDYKGLEKILRILEGVYHFGVGLEHFTTEGDRQYREIDRAVAINPEMLAAMRQLEQAYDAQVQGNAASGQAELSPEVERFLKDLERGGQS